MLIIGVIVLVAGIALMVGAGRVTGQQSRRAGADPSQGEMAYSWQGGVSKTTSFVMLCAWVLVIVGLVLTVVGLL